jgi:hypothetical protein
MEKVHVFRVFSMTEGTDVEFIAMPLLIRKMVGATVGTTMLAAGLPAFVIERSGRHRTGSDNRINGKTSKLRNLSGNRLLRG